MIGLCSNLLVHRSLKRSNMSHFCIRTFKRYGFGNNENAVFGVLMHDCTVQMSRAWHHSVTQPKSQPQTLSAHHSTCFEGSELRRIVGTHSFSVAVRTVFIASGFLKWLVYKYKFSVSTHCACADHRKILLLPVCLVDVDLLALSPIALQEILAVHLP
jgi:hypothetical protein